MVGVASNLAPLTNECEGSHGVYEADRALVARMRAGDQRAFDEFFKDSAPRLVAFIARSLSLDEPEAVHRWEEMLCAPRSQEPVSQLQAATERAEIMKVFDGLPVNYAHVLEAKYGDGLSVETIALQLGLTEIAVQSMLARAREAFRQRWQRRSAT